jgi:hypothetical protein
LPEHQGNELHYSKASRLTRPATKRPREYNDSIAWVILERLGDGEILHDICANPGMPHPVTFFRWVGENPEYAKSYYAALLARFDKMANECIKIADDASNDFVIETNEEGIPRRKLNMEAIQRTRERIKVRQWAAAKELPRKYGDLPPIEVAAPAPQQLEGAPQTEDHVYLARQAVSQLLGPRAITDPE